MEQTANKDETIIKEDNIFTKDTINDSDEKTKESKSYMEEDEVTNKEISERSSTTPTDAYHYLKLGEYSSELFKVVVQNIPSRIKYGWFRDEMKKILGFKPKKIKYNERNNHAFIACSDKEEKNKAISLLNNRKWKGKILVCKAAPPAKDPFVESNKRKQNSNENYDGAAKKSRSDSQSTSEDQLLSPEERLVKCVCPFSNIPYEEQLKLKKDDIKNVLRFFTSIVKKENLADCWTDKNGDLVCVELEEIIPSPTLTHYRNKVEFTIGVGPDKKDNTVGFRVGSYKTGSMLIVNPSKAIHCPKDSIAIAKEFEEWLQSLTYSSYNVGTHVGLWQQLFVRSSTLNNIMVILQISRKDLSNDGYEQLCQQVKEFLDKRVKNDVTISSLYLSWSSQNNSNVDKYDHLFGDTHIYEQLVNCKFRISPDSFFQVNTRATELLYNKVFDWCDSDQSDSCILDVCCGTGTIGICMASKTSLPVYGIEICEQAIGDAKYNAQINGVSNAEFLCGPAEKLLRDKLEVIKHNNIIAIVDPPRAGLHKKVIDALRSCSAIKKIIYVACSPKQAVENFLSFSRPTSKRRHGIPFKVTRAIPVDLFPQTRHCELIVELVRKSTVSELSRNKEPKLVNMSAKSESNSDELSRNRESNTEDLSGTRESNLNELSGSESLKLSKHVEHPGNVNQGNQFDTTKEESENTIFVQQSSNLEIKSSNKLDSIKTL